MHTSHLNHLDIGLRLAGYCTLVAFFRIVELNQDGRMQHVVFGLSQSTLEEAQDLRENTSSLSEASVCILYILLMSVATECGRTRYCIRTWRMSARVVLHIF